MNDYDACISKLTDILIDLQQLRRNLHPFLSPERLDATIVKAESTLDQWLYRHLQHPPANEKTDVTL